jgi:signal peptidase I
MQKFLSSLFPQKHLAEDSQTELTQQPTIKNLKATSRKKQTREWFDAIIFAVLAATFVRWCVVEPCNIPTPSMAGTLKIGDFVMVSKFHYGIRTPKTLLQIPLTHQTIWGTNKDAYVDWIQLPMWRLPAISQVKRNDVVVFNYPGNDEEKLPIDMRTIFIKRCVGIPNDKFEVIGGRIYIQDKPAENPPNLQSSYYVVSKEIIPTKTFNLVGIDEVYAAPNGFYVNATVSSAKNLQNVTGIEDVIPSIDVKGNGSEKIFPFSGLYQWNLDNFGALVVPAKDMTITIDEKSLALYESVIRKHEDNEKVEIKNNSLYINDLLVKEYTFKQNYYLMFGDNRHNSDDSRMWGFVPENHIIGKAMWTLWSISPEGDWLDFFSRVRWERILTEVK